MKLMGPSFDIKRHFLPWSRSTVLGLGEQFSCAGIRMKYIIQKKKTKYRELERRCGSWVNLYSKAEDNQSLCPVCICPGGASSPDDHCFAINHHIMHLRIEQHQAITINDVPLIRQLGSLLRFYLLATPPVARAIRNSSMFFRFGIISEVSTMSLTD